jgi:HK97 family phage prohead protease
MASEKFTKSVEFKATDDEKGTVEAVFSVFNNIDTDGDVVVPGAIKSGFKDNQVPMVFAHKWDQPIGKGTIVSDNNKAVFKGNFFMGTEAGREAYNLAKEMGDLQEWSFGFRIHDYEVAPFKKDGEEEVDVRYLKDLEVYEVSPVLVGANRETYTLAIKSGEESVYESSSEKAALAQDVFDNAEEAEKRAEELGCSGHHIHEVEGKEVFMPCSTHDAYEDAIKVDEEKGEDKDESTCCSGDCCQSKKYHSCDYGDTGKCAKEEEKSNDEDLSEKESSLQGVRFSDEVKDVLAALESLIVRAKAISILREKDGRTISDVASSALRAVQEDLNDAWNEIDSILSEPTDAEPEEDTEDVPVDEAPAEEIQEDAEIAEAEVEVSEEEDVVIEEDSEEDEVEEAEEDVNLDEVDAEFEALFAEAQENIAESLVLELDEDEEV